MSRKAEATSRALLPPSRTGWGVCSCCVDNDDAPTAEDEEEEEEEVEKEEEEEEEEEEVTKEAEVAAASILEASFSQAKSPRMDSACEDKTSALSGPPPRSVLWCTIKSATSPSTSISSTDASSLARAAMRAAAASFSRTINRFRVLPMDFLHSRSRRW